MSCDVKLPYFRCSSDLTSRLSDHCDYCRYASVFPRLPAMLQGLAGGADEEAGEGQVELGREEMVEFLLETARLVRLP